MNAKQFELATKGSRLSPENLKIARRVLVDNISRTEVQKEFNIIKQRIPQLLASIQKKFNKNLGESNLVFVEMIINESEKEQFLLDEKNLIDKHLEVTKK